MEPSVTAMASRPPADTFFLFVVFFLGGGGRDLIRCVALYWIALYNTLLYFATTAVYNTT